LFHVVNGSFVHFALLAHEFSVLHAHEGLLVGKDVHKTVDLVLRLFLGWSCCLAGGLLLGKELREVHLSLLREGQICTVADLNDVIRNFIIVEIEEYVAVSRKTLGIMIGFTKLGVSQVDVHVDPVRARQRRG